MSFRIDIVILLPELIRIPFASNLEKGYLANNWMDQGIKEVIRF